MKNGELGGNHKDTKAPSGDRQAGAEWGGAGPGATTCSRSGRGLDFDGDVVVMRRGGAGDSAVAWNRLTVWKTRGGAMDLKLNGQTAVVAGGASGIGLASVRLLLAEGAKVAIWDLGDSAARAVQGLIETNPALERVVQAVSADVTRSDQLVYRPLNRVK